MSQTLASSQNPSTQNEFNVVSLYLIVIWAHFYSAPLINIKI